MKTFKEMLEFNDAFGSLKNKVEGLENSKFGYAALRVMKKSIAPVFTEFNEELDMLRVEYALVDEKTKEVLMDKTSPRGFKYDKSSLMTLIKAEHELNSRWNDKEFKVEPYIVKEIPENLTEEQVEAFTGFVM